MARYSRDEAAERLGLSYDTLSKAIKDRRLPGKLSGAWTDDDIGFAQEARDLRKKLGMDRFGPRSPAERVQEDLFREALSLCEVDRTQPLEGVLWSIMNGHQEALADLPTSKWPEKPSTLTTVGTTNPTEEPPATPTLELKFQRFEASLPLGWRLELTLEIRDSGVRVAQFFTSCKGSPKRPDAIVKLIRGKKSDELEDLVVELSTTGVSSEIRLDSISGQPKYRAVQSKGWRLELPALE